MKIIYRNRLSGKIVTEKIFQENTLRWLYENSIGYVVFYLLLNRKIFHLLYGKYQNSIYSRHEIPQFIIQYEINITELVLPPDKYFSFNAFFTRKLKPSARPFVVDGQVFCAPGDGKVTVYARLNSQTKFQIKGQHIYIHTLLADSINANIYSHGAALVLRLAPYDYHRFHIPANGIAQPAK